MAANILTTEEQLAILEVRVNNQNELIRLLQHADVAQEDRLTQLAEQAQKTVVALAGHKHESVVRFTP